MITDLSEDITKSKNNINGLFKKINELESFFPDEFTSDKIDISRFLEFLNNPDIHIAVVGAIKAGKSSLMNAFLKNRVSPTEVTPETAAVTIFKYSEKDIIRVKFYNKIEWENLWNSALMSKGEVFINEYNDLKASEILNEFINREDILEMPSSKEELLHIVKKYSSSKSPIHYFVKEIEIGLNDFSLPKEICFVDTPGLNDVVSYRSQITRDYINRANAVIVCIDSHSMRNEEYLTIVKVFENIGDNKEKVIILGTQIDRLNNPNADWIKQKEEWSKYLRGFFPNDNTLKTNLIGVSSYIYSLIIDLETKKAIDSDEIDNILKFSSKHELVIVSNENNWKNRLYNLFIDKRKSILKNSNQIKLFSNIEYTINKISNELLSNTSVMLRKDINFRLNVIKENLHLKTQRLLKDCNDVLNVLDMEINNQESFKKEKENQILQIEKFRQELDNNFEILKNEIESSYETIESEMKKQLEIIKRKEN